MKDSQSRRYNFFSKDYSILLYEFEGRLEKSFHGIRRRDPALDIATIDQAMLDVLHATKELYDVAIQSPQPYMVLTTKAEKDVARFKEEMIRNRENLDDLQRAYIKHFILYDSEALKTKYGNEEISLTIPNLAAAGSVAIEKVVEKKLKPSIHWKQDLEERYSPPAQEPEGSGGSWVSRIQGAKSGRGLG